jgi:hypothetical protein
MTLKQRIVGNVVRQPEDSCNYRQITNYSKSYFLFSVQVTAQWCKLQKCLLLPEFCDEDELQFHLYEHTRQTSSTYCVSMNCRQRSNGWFWAGAGNERWVMVVVRNWEFLVGVLRAGTGGVIGANNAPFIEQLGTSSSANQPPVNIHADRQFLSWVITPYIDGN